MSQSLQFRQQWGQFVFDVDNMLTWLYEAISDQSQLMSAFGETPSLDAIVKHHRVIIYSKTFIIHQCFKI